ncbi:MAG: hypothetical protein ABEJ72_10780 [Candidatus Aenigmatarchaeota archaeon]
MKCEVCGRTDEDLEEEFGKESEIKEHQGINKCSKCIREYTVETDTSDEGTEDTVENKDWKDELFA